MRLTLVISHIRRNSKLLGHSLWRRTRRLPDNPVSRRLTGALQMKCVSAEQAQDRSYRRKNPKQQCGDDDGGRQIGRSLAESFMVAAS